MATPSPSHPGSWAYRMLGDGTLLETELTREEWLELHAKASPKERENLSRLNEHPLNRAAVLVLKKAGINPQSCPPEVMPLLDLAISCLAERDKMGERLMTITHWGSSAENQRKALSRLEQAGVSPTELEGMDIEAAAQWVVAELVM